MLRKKRNPGRYPKRSTARRLARITTSQEYKQRGHRPPLTLYEHLFESAPDANILVNHNGEIITANQQAKRLFGFTHNEIIGQPIERLVPETSRQIQILYKRSDLKEPTPLLRDGDLRNEPASSQYFPARRKDGSKFLAEISLNLIQSEVSRLVICTIRDISQRIEREQEMNEQSSLVRLLQDIAIAANEAPSTRSAFQFTLDRLCQYLGWPIGHGLLPGDEDMLLPTGIWCNGIPERFSVFQAVSEALQYKQGKGLPGMVMSSGQPVWLNHLPENSFFARRREARQVGLNTGLALPVLAGKSVVGVLEFFHEEHVPPDPKLLAVLPHIGVQLGRVVERELAQVELRKSAAQLRTVVTNLPVILWVTDREGRLILLEGRGTAAISIDSKNLLGFSLFERLGQRPDLQAIIRRGLAGEEIHTEISAESGSIFDTFLTPYRNEKNEIEGIIGLSIDISERKRMEIEVEELRRRLMDSIDIERARLAQQLHDGPLQDLYGAFYQLQEIKNKLEPPDQEITNRALQTIQQVNATLRVICGELRPSTLVHLGLQKAIWSYTELVRDRLEVIAIHLDLDEDVQMGTQTLPHNLRLGLFRVYQQLLTNVVRHSNARHVWVRLRLNPNQVILEVQDNGKGFTTPEHWIDMVRKGHFGLVNVQERVRGLDGKMEIETNPGQGTLVRVTLPKLPIGSNQPPGNQ